MKYLILLFLISCSHVFYQPDDHVYSTPSDIKLEYEDLYFKAADGTKLHAWHLKTKNKNPLGTIIYFHGNAENISSHYFQMAWLTKESYDIVAIDYRGYGKSEGDPDQKGVYLDALAGLKLGLEKQQERQTKKLIVYGQSLGGVISLRALEDFEQKKAIDLLVLDSTFLSYQKLANDKLRSIWLTWPLSPLAYVLVSDDMAAGKSLQKTKEVPTLVIHGENDFVVPYKFGEEIYQMAGSKKWLWKLKKGRHIDVFYNHELKYRKKFIRFICLL